MSDGSGLITALERDLATLQQLYKSYQDAPQGNEFWSTEAAFNDFARRFAMRHLDVIKTILDFYKVVDEYYTQAHTEAQDAANDDGAR